MYVSIAFHQAFSSIISGSELISHIWIWFVKKLIHIFELLEKWIPGLITFLCHVGCYWMKLDLTKHLCQMNYKEIFANVSKFQHIENRNKLNKILYGITW